MSFDIFNRLQLQILPPITDVVAKSSDLIGWVAPLILGGATLALIVYGLEVMRGSGGQQYVIEGLLRISRPFLVLNIALLGGVYAGTIVAFFTELRTDLSTLFGATGANSYDAIDGAVANGLDTIANLVPYANQQISIMEGNFQGLLIYVCMGVIALALLFYAVVAAFNLLVVDASLALIYGLGPLFVAAFAFKATAKFFDSWLSAVLKFTLTAVFIGIFIGLSNSLIQKFASKLTGVTEAADFIGIAAASLATAGILVALVVRASSIAADLVGGSSFDFSSGVGALKAAAPAASGVGRAGAYAGGAAAGAAGRAVGAAGAVAARQPLGLQVLRATESMRAQAGSAASKAGGGMKNFGNAVAGKGTDPNTGRTTYGNGVGNAYNIGKQATGPGAGVGTGTVSGGPPKP